jgi:hypothetical protein
MQNVILVSSGNSPFLPLLFVNSFENPVISGSPIGALAPSYYNFSFFLYGESKRGETPLSYLSPFP